MISPPPADLIDSWPRMSHYLEEVESWIRTHEERVARQQWEFYTAGLDEVAAHFEAAAMNTELAELFLTQGLGKIIETWLDSGRLPAGHAARLRRLLHKGKRLAVDGDRQVLDSAREVDRWEIQDVAPLRRQLRSARSAGKVSAEREIHQQLRAQSESHVALVVKLFARRELLARRAGYSGYVELALLADAIDPGWIIPAIDRLEQATRAGWQQTMAECGLEGAPATDVPALLSAAGDESLDTDLAADCTLVWKGLQARFAPWLDGVAFRHGEILATGFCLLTKWPGEVRIGVRDRTFDNQPGRLDLAAFTTLLHEVGHALHFRLLAAAGASFMDWFYAPPALGETFADLTERLAFQPRIWELTGMDAQRAAVHRARVQRARLWFLRQQIGRVRFELQAYHMAAEAPEAMYPTWRALLSHATCLTHDESHWAVDGHGFYTEDPMLRYAYLVAASWAESLWESGRVEFAAELDAASLEALREWSRLAADGTALPGGPLD